MKSLGIITASKLTFYYIVYDMIYIHAQYDRKFYFHGTEHNAIESKGS